MEVPEMDEVKKAENHMRSPVAFVEGGVQDACDDACSICLEAFCDSDPSTVTICKHEFHLQCILEWCQRSSNCPMCWQSISLKDHASQELLEAVERERDFRFTPSRHVTIFHHPTLGDFELQHLPMELNDPEMEDRIIRHLAAAAAMGRTHRVSQGEGLRSHSSAHTSSPLMSSSVQTNPLSASSSGSLVTPRGCQGIGNENRNFASESSVPNLNMAGPSELQSFPDNWKSRLNTVSMKYKESIAKSTRGWKEKLFSRSSSVAADIGSEVKREVNAGIATVSRMMERLETRENNTPNERASNCNNTSSSVASSS